MKKQTAVEWLVEQLKERGYAGEFPPHLLFDQAKAMEKEQIMEFVYSAVRKILDEDRQNPFNLEQYYNETFKSE